MTSGTQKEMMQTAGEATRHILRGLYDVMREQEPGSREGLEPSFLHDFRVALRRTRSALSRLSDVLPADVRDRFATEFKWLGAVTSPTRDFDVFLELLPTYEASLGEALAEESQAERTDLSELRDRLRRRRDEEQRAMVEQLDSQRHEELKQAWEAFLATDPAGWDAPDAQRPAREVASAEIWRSYQGSLERAAAITDDSPDEEFHELRKDLKKLRYLLEFFRDLYPPDEIDASVVALKSIQDVLGEINDLAVQRQIVEDLLGDTEPDHCLLAYLEARLKQQRDSFPAAFAEFGSDAVDRRFRTLFLQPDP